MIRGLKGRQNANDIDLSDEEMNEVPLKAIGD